MRLVVTLLLTLTLTAVGYAQEEVAVGAVVKTVSGQPAVVVRFTIPAQHYVYSDQVSISAGAVTLTPLEIPKPKLKPDPFNSEDVAVFEHDVTFSFRPSVVPPEGIPLRVGYQACNQSICFRPMSETFVLGATTDAVPPAETPRAPVATPDEAPDSMTVVRTAVGYLDVAPFLSFLDAGDASSEQTSGEGFLDRLIALGQSSVWLGILATVIGGLLLNLTPCVLPMIPINIAIIGAGAQAGSRLRGALLGGTYGLGIALAYGALGIVVVLTGSQFGALNTSFWFNIVIAVVFGLLALSMFGIFNIDFSRFQSGTGSRRSSFPTAFVFGAVAAILAGACVAPVLIFVLVWSTDLYQGGNVAGLLLPLLLGVGMAIPWPFAGAGLSFLPKPGAWMEKVKYGFGILILLLAINYGRKGYTIHRNREMHRPSLQEIVQIVEDSDTPVLIDFVSSTCTACKKMDRTTLKDSAVAQALARDFTFIKYNADQAGDPEVKRVLDHFNVSGFPTYVIVARKRD